MVSLFVVSLLEKKLKQKVPEEEEMENKGRQTDRQTETARYGVVQDFNRGGKKTKEGFFFGK